MKSFFVFAILFVGVISARADSESTPSNLFTTQATRDVVTCESNKFKVTIAPKNNNHGFEAIVLIKNSSGEWSTFLVLPVERSTTRGSNLLFIGDDFGLGVVSERTHNGSHPGTLRIWTTHSTIDETVICNF